MNNPSANLTPEQMAFLIRSHIQFQTSNHLANQTSFNAPASPQALAQFQMSQMALQQAQLAAAASGLLLPGMMTSTTPAGFSAPLITGTSTVGTTQTISRKLSDKDIDMLASANHLEEGNKNLDEIFRDLAAVSFLQHRF